MAKRTLFNMTIVILLILFLGASCSIKKDDFSIKPRSNNGKKWRVGYLEGGPFVGYPMTLKALVQGLSSLGWVEEVQFPAQSDETATEELWAWMANNVKSQYIEFAADAYWSNRWDNVILRPKTKQEIIKRLNGKKDIDLMIAMGTWAGKDLAADVHSVPTVVVAARNPVLFGIIKNADDSGHKHVHARVDATRYERQVRQFHDIFNFKRLGVVFDKGTPAGRNFAGIGQIENVAAERGFVIVSCDAPAIQVSKETAEQAVIECYQELAPKVDAVYVTTHRGFTQRKIQKILAPINQYKLPSFSQSVSMAVRSGVLMGNAEAGYQLVGQFYAQTIARIFNGASPGDLPLVFEDPFRLAINMKTAKIIGYTPTTEIMQATDEVFN